MNKSTVTILGGTVGLILTVSACGGSTYDYEVSGQMVDQQISVECPKGALSLEAVSFEVKGGGKGGKKGKAKSKKAKKNSSTSQQSRPTASATPKAPSTRVTSTPGVTPSTKTTRKPVKNVGVTLSEKPEKPERLKGLTVPKQNTTIWRKGCETEYEIFVLAKDGFLYEQDVRLVDYKKCRNAKTPKGQDKKPFPLCTKG